MRHASDEMPSDPKDLHGRLLYTAHFVADSDLAHKSVLNIGFGFGWFELFAIAKGVQQAVGMDLTTYDLEVARRHVSDERTSLLAGSADALPFGDQSFDTVVCWEVLEHVPVGRELNCFAEARRVLRSGGVFYVSTPYESPLSVALDPAWWLIKHRHYSELQIRKFASLSGFNVVGLSLVGRAWDILSWWNLYIAKWLFGRRPFLSSAMDRRLDGEFMRESGFTELFCRMVAT